ncbi:MAG TPA: hypothetical protein VFN97_24810 [Actinospica sp.]|nr:hypothetical protein [Actinospica sp.]
MAEPVGTHGGTVSITPTARHRLVGPLLLLVVAVIQLPNVLRHSSDPSVNHLDAVFRENWLLTFVPIYTFAFSVLLLPVRVELGENALVLHRPLRRRRVLCWRNIQCVLVDVRGSRHRVMVYGDDPDGRRIALPVPYSSVLAEDACFGEKFHLINQAWVERRGEDWVEIPAPRPGWLPDTDPADHHSAP